ncbi:hypothetical protein RJ639_036126 [Escallonia herrerae]|uniref:Transposase (putative) gypsy type domain-containing protein n=1 Tax=Escallonia herrerae TaxID=1293975 RepID=A0AA89B931_9ASTE|nr:hypothetical protein RJ639_036126 [Escallonia herrerae]
MMRTATASTPMDALVIAFIFTPSLSLSSPNESASDNAQLSFLCDDSESAAQSFQRERETVGADVRRTKIEGAEAGLSCGSPRLFITKGGKWQTETKTERPQKRLCINRGRGRLIERWPRVDSSISGEVKQKSAQPQFCSGIIVLGQVAFCSGRVLGHNSALTKLCSAKWHFTQAECSATILPGQNCARPSGILLGQSARPQFCSLPKLAIENMSKTSTSAFTSEKDIVVSSSSSSSSERVPTSGSEVGTLNPQPPQPSTSQPVQPSTSQPPQPSTSQPSHSLPAKNALRDVKDQAEDKVNPKPWYTADEKSSKMSTEDLLELIREYPLPEGWYARLLGLQEPSNYGTKFETGIYEEQANSGYRLPLHPFAIRFFKHYHMAPGQLVLNGWRKLVGLIYLVKTSGYKPDAIDFMRVFFKIYFVKGVANCPGWYYIHSRQRLLKGGPKSNKGCMGRMDKWQLPFDRD